MGVDEFAIGFPPRIWALKRGETTYAINWIPLGGYVKIHGENSEEDDGSSKSFQQKPAWSRILVIIAGVVMNLLFALIALSIAFSFGITSSSSGLGLETIPGAKVSNQQVIVEQILTGSAAEKAGLQLGDVITKLVNPDSGQVTQVNTPEDLQNFSKQRQASEDRTLTVFAQRDGKAFSKTVAVAASGPALGVGIDGIDTVKLPIWRAPQGAVKVTGVIIADTWDALKEFASKLFIHAQLDQNVSGPIGIYHATSMAAQQGAMSVLFLMITLSVNLALLNILPISPLDGGKLLFLLIEFVSGRRVHEKIENYVALAGMAALFILILLVSVNDIRNLF